MEREGAETDEREALDRIRSTDGTSKLNRMYGRSGRATDVPGAGSPGPSVRHAQPSIR
jgi:hypothetical protein